MTQITHQDEFVRFLKILKMELQEHQKACDNFLMQIQKPVAKILRYDTSIDVKPALEQEQKPESVFAFKH